MHRKANKTETENLIKAKVDIEEVQNILTQLNNKVDISEFDKLYTMTENKAERGDITNIMNSLQAKAEMKDFELVNVCYQELKREQSKRIGRPRPRH